VPERVWERRLETLQGDGRERHPYLAQPAGAEFLDLCDRLGFLVMAEAFDEWTLGKVPEGYHKYFSEWSERDVTDFVHRDRNHPSIVLWSAGNEIGEQDTPDGVQVLRRLVDIFHREDPTRPVTTGNDHIAADGGRATEAFLNAEDVVGYNYVDRWHERREIFAEPDRHDHPDWKMIGTESGPGHEHLWRSLLAGERHRRREAQLHDRDDRGRAAPEVGRHARLLRGRLHCGRD